MWPLIGVGVIAAGFLLRLNPLLAVALAAMAAGLAAGKAPLEVIALFGKAFNDNRFVSERTGVREGQSVDLGGRRTLNT